MTEATFLQGDCLEVLPTLPKQSIDLVFCDLPYGVTASKWDVVIPMDALWKELLRVGRPDAVYVLTATQPFATTIISANMDMFCYDLIWDKLTTTGYLNAKKQPLRKHEHILVFGDAPRYNPQMSAGRPYRTKASINGKANANYGAHKAVGKDNPTGERYPTSVISQARDGGLHPTQKPIGLMRYIIKTYTYKGQTVLDPTAGSGSTLVAGMLSGRNVVGIEKDPVIFANAKERVMAVQRSLKRNAT